MPGSLNVWVMSLASGIPVWDSASWYVENRLIPVRSNQTISSMGTADFRLLRRTRQDTVGVTTVTSFTPARGQYVAITTAACSVPGASGTLWVGFFDGVDVQPLKGTADEIGTASARELGAIFDQIPVANLHEADPSLVTAAGFSLLTNPSMNEAGLNHGEVIGNALAAPAAEQPGQMATTRMQFATLPADQGTLWSRFQMLDHAIRYVNSANVPTITLSMSASVKTLMLLQASEVIPLKGLTLKGLFDLLAGTSRGLYWNIVAQQTIWVVFITSGIDVATGDIPAASVTNYTLAKDEGLVLHDSGFDVYDAVEVVGNPVVFGGTVSLADATLSAGWSSSQEVLYKAGGSSYVGPPAYASLNFKQQCALNKTVRGSGLMTDVYVRYLLTVNASYDFMCKNVAGQPVAGSTIFFCPQIDWSGTTATVSATVDRGPYPPEARLLPTLPWPQGLRGDGVDNRGAEQKVRPNYVQPVVLGYNVTGSSPLLWTNFAKPTRKSWPSASISMDQRAPAIRVQFPFPETLAFSRWLGAPGSAGASTEYDPTLTTQYGSTDFANLVCTVAMESDQSIKVTSYRSGYSSANARNTLRINRPDLNCWMMHQYSILGLKPDGTPDELSTNNFIRNDWAVAQKLADELAALAFRKRTGAQITTVDPVNPWTGLGVMLGTVTDAGVVYSLSTYITNIESKWDEKKPRFIVTTSDPPLPESTALVGAVGPGLGGTVSAALSGTMASKTQSLDSQVRALQKSVAGMPISHGHMGSGTDPEYARILWNFPALVDTCEAELVDETGVTNSGTRVWIDGVNGLALAQPGVFGDVYYKVTANGYATRSAVKLPLYTVLGVAGIGPAGASRAYEVALLSGGTTGNVYASGATLLQTTILGTAKDIVIPTYTAFSTTSFRYDTQLPAKWGQPIASLLPFLMPDIMQLGRKRASVAVGDSAGTAITLSGLSIDAGKVFTLDIEFGHASSALNSKGSAKSRQVLSFYRYTSTQYLWNSAGLGSNYQIDPVTPANNLSQSNHWVNNAGVWAGAGATSSPASISYYVSASGAGVGSVQTATIAFTNGADGRMTQIVITPGVAVSSMSVVLTGGRPLFGL